MRSAKSGPLLARDAVVTDREQRFEDIDEMEVERRIGPRTVMMVVYSPPCSVQAVAMRCPSSSDTGTISHSHPAAADARVG